MSSSHEAQLGDFLREKRQQISPETLGLSLSRRRTPGLRREEVAQRANISVTWYTWLEQGRGGMPSAEVLKRIAQALLLAPAETEYLFLTTLGRTPDARYELKEDIAPRLQTILDALNPNPALIRNLTWDVLAWNTAASRVLTDYSLLAPSDRNIMKIFFTRNATRSHNPDWLNTARLIVNAFRADLARLGENTQTSHLIASLCQQSEDFKRLWSSHEVNEFSSGLKVLNKPDLGELSLHYSSFNVSGSPELSLVVYTPFSDSDREIIESVIKQ